MNPDSLSRIAAAAGESGLDAVIAMSPENFAYLSGVMPVGTQRARSRHLMIVVRPNGETALFAHEAEAEALRARFADVALATWSEGDQSAIDSLADMLWDMSLSAANIGIETDYLSARDLLALGAALPKAEFSAGEDLFATARLTKAPRELALVTRAAHIAEDSVEAALSAARAGVSERAIAAELARAALAAGGEGITVVGVASGTPDALEDLVPGDQTLQSGHLCRAEIVVHVGGYHACVRRTGLVKARGAAKEPDDGSRNARDILASLIRPGAGVRDIQRDYLKQAAPLEAPPKTPVAHGIGLSPDEPPLIGAEGKGVIVDGMVLVLEPLVHQRNQGFDLASKIMAQVTASGIRLLTGDALQSVPDLPRETP